MLVALNLFGVFEVTLSGGAMTKASELTAGGRPLGAGRGPGCIATPQPP